MNKWSTKKLGDVAVVFDGPHATPRTVDSGPIFLGISALQDGVINLSETRHVTEEDFKQWTRRVKPQVDDVVFSYETRLGQAAIIPEGLECCLGRRMGLIRFRKEILLPRFFLYQYLSPLYGEFLASRTVRGATVDRISIKEFPSFPVAVPSLSEQRRIVDALDESFRGVATAKANAEKNLQNARDLFESHLQSVFARGGEGWEKKRLEEIIESNVIGLIKSSREQGCEKSWPYLKMNNITRDNRLDLSDLVNIDASLEEVCKFQLKRGDFLFNTRNSFELVGKSCIYEPASDQVVLYNNNIMRIRFVAGVDARFVLLALSYRPVAEALNSLKSGTTNVSAIYFRDLSSLAIPIPPSVVQQQIAAELAELNTETQRLSTLYQRKLAALDELKKSLLHQAFTGNL